MKRSPASPGSFATTLIALVLAHSAICHALMSAAAPRVGIDLPLPIESAGG